MTGETLALRVLVGIWLAASGAQKAFGWFGGEGLRGTSEELAELGYPIPRLMAVSAAGTELVGGSLVASGLLFPFGCFLLMVAMLTGALALRLNGFWNQRQGFEYPLFVATVVGVLAFAGPGRWSVDRVLGLTGHHVVWGAASVAAAVGAAITNEIVRTTHGASSAAKATESAT